MKSTLQLRERRRTASCLIIESGPKEQATEDWAADILPLTMSETRSVPRRESPWGRPEGDHREPKAHRCNDRAEDVIQVTENPL